MSCDSHDLSGVFEILGGVGLLIARVHRAAAFGLIALYVAVFPANINMAVNDIQLGDVHIPTWALWLRLPLQAGLIVWAWWLSRSPQRSTAVSQRRPRQARCDPRRAIDLQLASARDASASLPDLR